MNVPLLDLKAQYKTIKPEVMAAVEAVCDEQGFILGPRVAEFEQALAKYVGTGHAVGCASGTDAIVLALMAVGVGQGDEVITVPFTFFATAGSISRLGAKPVFVDIKPDTFNMDPGQIEKKTTARTKAIMPVHLFGQCADMKGINEIARRKRVRVIEDAAQAIGSAQDGTRAGALGDAGCLSFFPSKNLGGFGDGGAVTTNDKGLSEAVAMLRVHGSKVKYVHERVGFNSRLDALQAAILRVKLNHLDTWAGGRQRNAGRYERLFRDAGLLERITLPKTEKGNVHVYNQFTIRVQKRDELRAHLKDKGVGTEVYYPIPLHLQGCYRELGHQKGSFPVSEKACEEVLALPIYAELTEDQQAHVVSTIKEFFTRQ
ncbi:MAG TPA: DegT/DnrJ/EryC1/StrS family aminotransferase [Nitrospiraceae bacterium]